MQRRRYDCGDSHGGAGRTGSGSHGGRGLLRRSELRRPSTPKRLRRAESYSSEAAGVRRATPSTTWHRGLLGPELNGIATVAEGRIAGYTAEQYLWESIVDSCAYTVEDTDCNLMLNVMSTIVLSDADVDALVAFLLQQR